MFIWYYFDFDSPIPRFPDPIPRGMTFNSPFPEEWKNSIPRFPESPGNEKCRGIDSPNYHLNTDVKSQKEEKSRCLESIIGSFAVCNSLWVPSRRKKKKTTHTSRKFQNILYTQFISLSCSYKYPDFLLKRRTDKFNPFVISQIPMKVEKNHA